jgi:hypothetical protein
VCRQAPFVAPNISSKLAEIWGWKEQEEVEKMQEKYLRGVVRAAKFEDKRD